MSEYWKSTPKYLCKYCEAYVRDTKLERTNHEATAKHQSAVRRFLRNLHRGAEIEEREKERARCEIARLNGIVPPPPPDPSSSAAAELAGPTTGSSVPAAGLGGSSGGGGGGLPHKLTGAYAKPHAPPPSVTAAERKAQMEQLAELGVAIPQQFRGDLAMAGEWTTTAQRIIRRKVAGGCGGGGGGGDDDKSGAAGGGDDGRKRESDEQREENEAVQGLFKRQKVGRWGRDSKRLDKDEEEGLDALLGSVVGEKDVKKEQEINASQERDVSNEPVVKEEGHEHAPLASSSGFGKPGLQEASKVKLEDMPAANGAAAADKGRGDEPAVVFRRRKPKTARHKDALGEEWMEHQDGFARD